jgi:hypothetical protein
MIKEPTVFILGAGASHPYGFPTGAELREQIIGNFVSDFEHYLQTSTDRPLPLATWTERVKEFVQKFDESATRSIDLFLARNPEFAEIGKWAIVLQILKAERHSCFREHIQNREHDWYVYLLDKLTDDITTKDDYVRFSENKLSIITFNYDRSLEHFLYKSLTNLFNGIPLDQIKKQLGTLRIIHVFGQVAKLDWQEELHKGIKYRQEMKYIDVKNVAKQLRIIYEKEKNPELEEAQKLLNQASNVFFLGFGYAKENLNVLRIPELLRDEQQICGTALSFTTMEIEKVQRTFLQGIRGKGITGTLMRDIRIENSDCLTLLRTYL